MKITILGSGSIRSNFTYRALAFGRSLTKAGHDVSIIVPSADKYNDFIPEKADTIEGVKIWQPFQFATKRLEVNLLPYMFGAARRVLKEKPDIVYIYKPTPVSIVGLIAKLFYGTQTILDMDDLGSEVMKVEGHPVHQRKLVEWCEKLAARFADRIVAATNNLKQVYRDQYPDKPIHVMTNGVDVGWFVPTAPSQAPHRIVFMGAINRQNILEPLFDAMPDVLKRYPDATLLVMGGGTFLPYFKEKCEKLGISGSVEFTGWLKLEDAQERLHAGDIGYNYMPDTKTTRAVNNMKVPQYMARSVVPIVSDIGDLASIVSFGRAGYVCKADDAKAFTAALIQALDDPDRMEKSVRARAIALKDFNWDVLAQDFCRWMHPEVQSSKKIYFVSTSVPGSVGGGEIRNFNLVKQIMKQSGAPVEAFCISAKGVEAERKAFEESTSAVCHAAPARPHTFATLLKAVLVRRVPPFMYEFELSGLGDMFRAACEKSLPAVVHIEQPTGYYCIRAHIPWLRSRGVKIVFDCHNVEWQAFQDSLSISAWPKRFAGWLLVRHMRRIEIEAAEKADAVLACSQHDAAFFQRYNRKVVLVPNGVDCAEFAPKGAAKGPVIIFMGGVGYPPNADGLQFYLKDIHPVVKARVPGMRLLAIGAKKEWLDSIGVQDSSVEPLGFVDDVRPYLAQARLGICPIRHGSGTRIKILTYMAAGLPVVSTNKGAEGVGYVNGTDIVMADDPQAFADAAVRTLTNAAYASTMAKNGRDFVLKNFDWDVIGTRLAHIYTNETR